ncbi:MAG: hypothetical protein AB1899_14720 [Pseudomonadota bacterium]
MDPVFLAGEGHELHLPPWYPAQAMEAHLAHCLLRQPGDLTSHVRRILLWLEQPGHAGLADALADLDRVLDGKGGALLGRLRERAAPLLAGTAPQDGRRESRYTLFAGQGAIPDPADC